MALDDKDRRRFYLAAVVTIVALPAIWWANREDDSTAPNVATAGVEIADGADQPGATPAIEPEPVGERSPVFLDGPAAEELPPVADIAVPAAGERAVRSSASFSSALPPGRCLSKFVTTGERVQIVNLENNRSVRCIIQFAPAGQREELLMSRIAFLELADLTDAPIPVEIRQ